MTPPDYDEGATGKAIALSGVDRKKIFLVTKVSAQDEKLSNIKPD